MLRISFFAFIQLFYMFCHSQDSISAPKYFLPFAEDISSSATGYASPGFRLLDTLDKTTVLSFKDFPVIVSSLSDSTFRITLYAFNPFSGNDEFLLQYFLYSDTCLYSITLDSLIDVDYSTQINSSKTPLSNEQYGYVNAIQFLKMTNVNNLTAYKASLKREKPDSKLRWFLPLFYSLGTITSEDVLTAQPAGQKAKLVRRSYMPDSEKYLDRNESIPVILPEK
jgi:hypothetical protein